MEADRETTPPRWSIVRLIWLRELRDQLRDRRTLFMIAVLPLLLYPALGFAVLQFAPGLQGRSSKIGIVRGPGGSSDFPELAAAGATAPQYPPLVKDGRFVVFDGASSDAEASLKRQFKIIFLAEDSRRPLDEGEVDLILEASPGYFEALAVGDGDPDAPPPRISLRWRPEDDSSVLAASRIYPLLETWERTLKTVRLQRLGHAALIRQPFRLDDPALATMRQRPSKALNWLVPIFPFMLVMWSLAGALYPAVDLCAGEKERGTMETLLISPAAREEIVLGKFLTIWVFSAATAWLNLISIVLCQLAFSNQIPLGTLSPAALGWCAVLVVPLSAFFSAISLAIGAYARSSKEGQYYLMPMFLISMPLVFLTLAPGVRLSPSYSLVPVTGVALLMQQLMTAPSLDRVPWLYFIPVLAPIALYSWLALRWAVEQFHREEVLFREAERLDLALWFRRLFRDKEATPSAGQALFLFAIIVFLRWFTLGLGLDISAIVHTAVSLLAFVAAPTLLMALMLNTRPGQTLALRPPQVRQLGLAAVLALLLLPPLAAVAQAVFTHFEELTRLLQDRQPMVQELRELRELPVPLLVFGLLPAVCEELAFRGFILSGLLRRFRPRNAILISSFLFALFHMNVFQFLPSFLLGVVLGLLTVRSRSVFPAMIFHFLHNSLLIAGMYLFNAASNEALPDLTGLFWSAVIIVCFVLAAGTLWRLYRKPYVDLARALTKSQEQLVSIMPTSEPPTQAHHGPL